MATTFHTSLRLPRDCACRPASPPPRLHRSFGSDCNGALRAHTTLSPFGRVISDAFYKAGFFFPPPLCGFLSICFLRCDLVVGVGISLLFEILKPSDGLYDTFVDKAEELKGPSFFFFSESPVPLYSKPVLPSKRVLVLLSFWDRA